MVRSTGGLKDTVVDCTPQTLANGSASGFLFTPMTADNPLIAVKRAAGAYHDQKTWQRLQKNGMAKDFSWHASATAYHDLYLKLRR